MRWWANYSSALRVRNMVEIVLGALVVIGIFVFWCDVTDAWNKCARLIRAFLPPYSKYRGIVSSAPLRARPICSFVRFSDNRWLAVFVRFVIVVLLLFFIVVIIGVSRRHQGADQVHPSEDALRDE